MHHKKHALVCLPADTLDQGLRMKNLGEVDIKEAQRQHRAYCGALREFDFSLVQLPPDNRYPDSVFVEDPAVITKDTLIITRLRKTERSGEEKRVERALVPFFQNITRIKAPGFVEGGDVLVTPNKLYIGLSERTNTEGAEQLAQIVRDHCGYTTKIFEIPKHFLHLKGEVTYHQNSQRGIITVSEEIAYHFSDSDCKLIVTPADERFGANCISRGSIIFIHARRQKTKQLLEQSGFHVRELEMSEFEKIDGALTCLSKLF